MSQFSWEINQARSQATLIAICEPPIGVSIDWAIAFSQLEKPQIWDIMRLTGLPWGEARTQAAMQVMNGGYSYLFFLDADVITPKNTLMRLLSHNVPIVSGLYYQRFPTFTGVTAEFLPCMFNEKTGENGVPTKDPILDWTPGEIKDVAYAPAGCLLIHRSVIENFLNRGVKRIFEWTLHADNPTGKSEDFEFTYRARQLGYRVLVDTTVICQHETMGRITPKGLVPKV